MARPGDLSVAEVPGLDFVAAVEILAWASAPPIAHQALIAAKLA